MFSGHGGPGHEIADAVSGVTVSEAGERLSQPLMGVDAADLAIFDERGDHRPVVATFVGPGKQGIFAIQCEGADRAFDGIGVEVDAAVFDEPGQSIPARERLADRLAELALGADLATAGGKILMKIIDDDTAAFGPSGTALLGG